MGRTGEVEVGEHVQVPGVAQPVRSRDFVRLGLEVMSGPLHARNHFQGRVVEVRSAVPPFADDVGYPIVHSTRTLAVRWARHMDQGSLIYS